MSLKDFSWCKSSFPFLQGWGQVGRLRTNAGKVSMLPKNISEAKLLFRIDFSWSHVILKACKDEVNIILFAQMVLDWIGMGEK